jgi:hypothetical protein
VVLYDEFLKEFIPIPHRAEDIPGRRYDNAGQANREQVFDPALPEKRRRENQWNESFRQHCKAEASSRN